MLRKFFHITQTERKLLASFVLFESFIISVLLYFYEGLEIKEAIFAFILNGTLHYFLSLPIFRLSEYYYRFVHKQLLIIALIAVSSLVYSLIMQALFYLPFLMQNNQAAMNEVRQQMHWQIFGHIVRYLLITGLSFMMIYLDKFKKEKEIAEKLKDDVKHAKLESLKYQLNPHFLFNSLNSIHSLIAASKDKSREMLLLLSSYLRYTLSMQNKSFVPISEEIEHIKRYFEIEKIRFEDRLNFKLTNHLNSDEEIPVLLLQPIIENMIKHGLSQTESDFIAKINFSNEDNQIIVDLENSLGNMEVTKINEGIGLKNVQKRLKMHFDHYTFNYKIDDDKFKCLIKYPMSKK